MSLGARKEQALVPLLRALRLLGMAEALEIQDTRGDTRPFADRLHVLIEAEQHSRATATLQNRLARADVPWPSADVAHLWSRPERGFTTVMAKAWARCSWAQRGQHLIITGDTGTGKTWLACALANAAMRLDLTVAYWNVPDLLAGWGAAQGDHEEPSFRRRLAKVDVLMLDDWGVEPLNDEDVAFLRRVILDRVDTKSLVIVSSAPIKTWREWLGGHLLAASVVDRLEKGAHRVALEGASLRTPPAPMVPVAPASG